MKCSRCALEQEPGSRFCIRCGAVLPGAAPPPSLERQRQVEALVSRAGLLRARKNIAAAISTCQEAIQVDPEYPWAHVLLAELYADTKRMEEALEHLERAAELHPDNPNIQQKLARLRPRVKRRAPKPAPEAPEHEVSAVSPPEGEPEAEPVAAAPPEEPTPPIAVQPPPEPAAPTPEPAAAQTEAPAPEPGAPLPDAVRRWNWGAFLLGLFWTPAHKLWKWFGGILAIAFGFVIVSVICLLLGAVFLPFAFLPGILAPFVILGLLVVAIFLGLRGGQLAWRERPFESVDQFLRVQRAWKIASFIVLAAFVLVFVILPIIVVVGGGAALLKETGALASLSERIEGLRPSEPAEVVPAPTPAEPSVSDRLAIKQVLRSFERALTGKDERALLDLIDPAETALRARTSESLSGWLPSARSVRASYRDESIEITGDRAVVKGVVTMWWTEGDSRKREERRFEMRLRKRSGKWLETGWQDWPIEPPKAESPDISALSEHALRLEGQLKNAGSPQEMAQIARAARAVWQEILSRDPQNAEARTHVSNMDEIIRASGSVPTQPGAPSTQPPPPSRR